MTNDLVKRLRLQYEPTLLPIYVTQDEIIKRIEQLEAALREIADGAVADNADDACHVLMKMARKALEGKDD
jgi:hypothetical protein